MFFLIDRDRAKRETLACNDIIHFNNTEVSLITVPVSDAIRDFHKSEASKPRHA